MLRTRVRVERSVLAAVRLRDVPGAAWTLALGYVPRGAGRPSFLPVVTWLYWCAVVLVSPGFRHRDRLVVARVARRSLGAQAVLLARMIGLVIIVELIALTLLTVPDIFGWWPMSLTVVVLGLVGAWVAISFLTALALMAPTVFQIWTVGVATRRALDKKQVAADGAQVRATGWTVDSVTSRRAHGGLAMVADHVRATVPAGERVLVQAPSAEHVRIYARFGLIPFAAAPWTLVGTNQDSDAQRERIAPAMPQSHSPTS